MKRKNLIVKRKAKKKFFPLQKGDIRKTLAENKQLNSLTNFRPNTSINYGVNKFIDWFLNYYDIKKKK